MRKFAMNKEFESIKQGIKEATQNGRPQLTKKDFEDMEKAIKVGSETNHLSYEKPRKIDTSGERN